MPGSRPRALFRIVVPIALIGAMLWSIEDGRRRVRVNYARIADIIVTDGAAGPVARVQPLQDDHSSETGWVFKLRGSAPVVGPFFGTHRDVPLALGLWQRPPALRDDPTAQPGRSVEHAARAAAADWLRNSGRPDAVALAPLLTQDRGAGRVLYWPGIGFTALFAAGAGAVGFVLGWVLDRWTIRIVRRPGPA
jgi:hypothetical protein